MKRATERRKPDAIMTVSQPFTPASFNFTKIRKEEILFELVKGGPSNGHLINGYQEDSTVENGSCSDVQRSDGKQVRDLQIKSGI